MQQCEGHKPNESECARRLANVSDALYVIGGKWKLRIIIALSEGPRRFNDLQRTVKGISAKVLSNELKDMELNGFLKRSIDLGTPVVVSYELTPYSETLSDVLRALGEWGARHKAKLRSDMHLEEAAMS